MKNYTRISIFCLFAVLLCGTPALAQNEFNTEENFPDAQFRAAVENFMGVLPGEDFTEDELRNKTGTFDFSGLGVADVTGLEYFDSVSIIDGSDNDITTLVDGDGEPFLVDQENLVQIDFSDNLISSIDVSTNTALESIIMAGNALASIDVSDLEELEYLDVSRNNLTSVDVTENANLKQLYANDNNLATVNLENNTLLNTLQVGSNNLTSLDLTGTGFALLETIDASNNNFEQVGQDSGGVTNDLILDATPTYLDVSGNDLSAVADNQLKISHLRNLQTLIASDSGLTGDLGAAGANLFFFNDNITHLDLSLNDIEAGGGAADPKLDTSNMTNLNVLDVSGNPNLDDENSIDLSANTELRELYVSRTDIGAQGDYVTDVVLNNTKLEKIVCRWMLTPQEDNWDFDDISDTLTYLDATGAGLWDGGTTNILTNFDNKSNIETLILAYNQGTNATSNLSNHDEGGGAGTVGIILTHLDDESSGSLRYVDVSGTGLDTFNFAAATGQNVLTISDPTSITTLITKENDLDGDDIDDLYAHTSIQTGDPTLTTVDFRESNIGAWTAAWYNNVRDIQDYIGEPTFTEFGKLVEGFAVLPTDDSEISGLSALEQANWPPPSGDGVRVLKPNGGEWFDNTAAGDGIAYSDGNRGHLKTTLEVQYISASGGGTEDMHVDLSTDGGTTWIEDVVAVDSGYTDDAPYMHTNTVNLLADPNGDGLDEVNSSQCLIRIRRDDDPDTYRDVSDNFFTIGRPEIEDITDVRAFSISTNNSLGMFALPGGGIQLNIGLDNTEDIISYQFQLSFDPDVFYYVDGSASQIGTAARNFNTPMVNADNTNGFLTIASSGLNEIPSGDLDTLVKIRLGVFSGATVNEESTISFINANTEINDEDGQLDFFGLPSDIYIGERFLWGDLNRDGVIGTVDAAEVLRYNVGLVNSFTGYPDITRPDFPEAADVNDDGVVGTLDASLILQRAALSIGSFPADDNADDYGPDPLIPSGKSGQENTTPRTLSATVEQANDSWVVNVSVNDAAEIAGAKLVLNYDPDQITLGEEIEMAAEGSLVVNNTKPGVLVVSGAFISPLLGGESTLMSIPFEPVGLVNDAVMVSLDAANSAINDGRIDISNTSMSAIELPTEGMDTTGVESWMFY